MHGTTMVFLFVVPVLAGFGNYFVPLMIGARDMAFPRLNALSFWLLAVRRHRLLHEHLLRAAAGRLDHRTPPLSDDAYLPGGGVDAWIFLIHLTGLSSIVGAINFVATIHNMRAHGHELGPHAAVRLDDPRLQLPADRRRCRRSPRRVTMLLTDRHFGTGFFDPTGGGDPMLWQHLFWFFGHPEVYIMVLPAFGMISEILPVFARKPIFGYKAIAASTVAIAFLGLLVWAHHMFTTPTATVVLAFFMLTSFTIAVPDRHQDLQLDRHALARLDRDEDAALLRGRAARPVRDRRHLGRDPRDLPGRLAAARHLLRGGPLPLRAVRRRGVRHLRRALLLVPEDDAAGCCRRALGKLSLLADVRRLQPHVPDPALRRACRACRGASTTTRRDARRGRPTT